MRYILSITLLLFSLAILHPQNSIKIAIIPLFNVDVTHDFDYLEPNIYDHLYKEILNTKLFKILDRESIIKSLDDNGFDYNRLMFDLDQENVRSILDISVNVTGFYKVKDEVITLYLKGFAKNKDVVDSINFEIKEDLDKDLNKFFIDSSKIMTDLLIDKYIKNLPVKDISLNRSSKKDKTINFNYKDANIGAKIILPIGGVCAATGLTLLLYDLIGVAPMISSPKTFSNYSEYEKSYNMFLGLYISGLSIMNLGFDLALISIPFFIYKRNLNIYNKIGVGLYSGGMTLTWSGITTMIYDATVIFAQVRKLKQDVIDERADYDEYVDMYFNNLYFFIASISAISLGSIITIASIPLLLNKSVGTSKTGKSELTLNFGLSKNLFINLSYKF